MYELLRLLSVGFGEGGCGGGDASRSSLGGVGGGELALGRSSVSFFSGGDMGTLDTLRLSLFSESFLSIMVDRRKMLLSLWFVDSNVDCWGCGGEMGGECLASFVAVAIMGVLGRAGDPVSRVNLGIDLSFTIVSNIDVEATTPLRPERCW